MRLQWHVQLKTDKGAVVGVGAEGWLDSSWIWASCRLHRVTSGRRDGARGERTLYNLHQLDLPPPPPPPHPYPDLPPSPALPPPHIPILPPHTHTYPLISPPPTHTHTLDHHHPPPHTHTHTHTSAHHFFPFRSTRRTERGDEIAVTVAFKDSN